MSHAVPNQSPTEPVEMPPADPQRLGCAIVASRGFGMGQIEARRFIEEQTPDGLEAVRAHLKEDLNVSQSLAQNRDLPFGEYVKELVEKGQLDTSAPLEVIYRAGFDIGFAASLVESLEAMTTFVPDADQHIPETGASIEGARTLA